MARGGCASCRKRKVKCDEQKPKCSPCIRMDLGCDYGPRLIWVDEDGGFDKSFARRNIPCGETWKNIPIFDSDLVDCLISESDPELPADLARVINTAFETPSFNPFGMFHLERSAAISPLDAIQLVPPGIAYMNSEEKFLFNHYVNYVAVVMMPFEHPRNPWKISYPARALFCSSATQKSLFSALLAQTAFNLTHLSQMKDHYMVMASKYYSLAMTQLMGMLKVEDKLNADVLATIMTLMMAEIYSGQSKNWRFHFQGAWDMVRKSLAMQSWEESDFARSSLQSLYIINIIGNSSKADDPSNENPDGMSTEDTCLDIANSTKISRLTSGNHTDGPAFDEEPVSSIKSTEDFGFTIGATREILECISMISDLSRSRTRTEAQDQAYSSLLCRLNACQLSIEDRQNTNDGSKEVEQCKKRYGSLNEGAYYQLRAFVSASYIYYFRTVFDLPPSALYHLVIETFENVNNFIARGCGNMSLWPAFIAAVEAYTEDALSVARNWLDDAATFGLGSRILVREVIEEIWKRREHASTECGIDKGHFSVDWKRVMKDLDVDILLV